jgi:chromosome segregation protein
VRLTHIKLAGFKSFVDPSHVPVPGQLVGVVGPNGCGKSNVIDAVRWVLGESSARQLRGESMQDVIFNGSGTRQPVSRASVELIFDNSLGKAAGPWSPYAEISVKRVLERDGESTYFINNQHVRRRDVADIFLGTGLGGRGYAIIEQGMISRIIEAKPEDLRAFLEEAAGVSKYRERRRETELRLEDTRENLLRVDDIRQELGKQLEHLEAQAQQAAKYRELEAQLKNAQQLLWLTRKRDAAAQRARVQRDLDAAGVELEAETARLREAERKVEALRAEHFAAADRVHAAQGLLYESNAEVARLEQEIEHLREARARAQRQLAAVRAQEAEQHATRAELEHNNTQSAAALETAVAQVDALLADLESARRSLPAAEEAYRKARAEEEETQRELSRAGQQLELERERHGHAEKLLSQLGTRKLRLEEERDSLELPAPSELVRLDRELEDLSAALARSRESLSVEEGALPEHEERLRAAQAEAEQLQQRLNQIEARLGALQALQEQVSRAGELEPWVERHALRRNPHLWQGLQVREGWEDALEAVLRERLNSIGLEDLGAVQALFSDPPPGKVSFHQLGAPAARAPAPVGLQGLAGYVTCTDPRLAAVLEDWLAGVYVLETPERGVELSRRLQPGALLVTAQGHIFTATSARFHAADSEVHGILSRQREMEALSHERGQVEAELGQARERVSINEAQLEAQRDALERLRREVSDLQESQHQLKLDHVRLSQQAERVASRGTQIVRELEEIETETLRESEQMGAAEEAIEALGGRLLELKGSVEAAHGASAQAEARLEEQRAQLQQIDREHQEAVFQRRTIEQKLSDIKSSLQLISQQLTRLASDGTALEAEIAQADETDRQTALQQALATRGEREAALAAARQGLEAVEATLHEIEQTRLASEAKLQPLRDRINELRLKEQESRLAEEGFAQQLAEAGADEATLGAQMEKGVRASHLQTEIARLNGEIAALGAVNLAALDELASSRERKAYLDSQSADLGEALTTLENAIRRIDRETRERLQETFDQVNRHFGQMFPALFGGGEARLEMTGEEILDAGVQVIARPPGKRNSSIHLLSGGEKALTALSLVFSMFQLNPAPFCLLDEVDAPLDDNNTVRFCELVKKMSESTQFLFITHNKITMELAQQLIGVTMQEQGVSRVVAVDIEEALRMREEAAA